MSDVAERQKKTRPLRRNRSIYQVHYDLRPQVDETMAKPLVFSTAPVHVQAYELQVAGHTSDSKEARYLGLLQCSNGTVLKPILKDSQQREVDFYKTVFTSTDPDLIELRKFIPKFYGTKKFTYNGYEQEYIILEDLTERMLEPCIMDVKIGTRTWDPLASEEKIEKEKSKYKECKEEFGFCIPGYQVYKLATGKLHKYNKDYGKKLHGNMVRAAVRNFVNGSEGWTCRALLVQQVAALWALQRWAARPRPLRLYAASVLLVYDAAKLRRCCAGDSAPSACRPPPPAPAPRRRSIHSLHPGEGGRSAFSGQVSATGPVYPKLRSPPLAPLALAPSGCAAPPPLRSPWTEALERLNHSHSFEHDYERKLSKIKMNYRATLDQLASDAPSPNPWGTVKLIDFAHAFFDGDERLSDDNFKRGLDNLVAVFEALLSETDDQVF